MNDFPLNKEHLRWECIQGIDRDQLLCDKSKLNRLYDMIRIKKKEFYIDALLIYTLWYEFSNDFDAQSDFGNNFVPKKLASCTILILSTL